MRMSPRSLALTLLVTLALVGGCNPPRSIAAMRSSMTPQDSIGRYAGDVHSAGGLADTGSPVENVSYGMGAAPDGDVPADPLYDAPAKGVGLHPGEHTVESRDGYGVSNAPAHQMNPAEVSDASVR